MTILASCDLSFSRPELEAALRDARTVSDLNRALTAVLRLNDDLSAPEVIGRQLFCPGLDAAIAGVARKLGLGDVSGRKSNENVCILASRLNVAGGHSRVAAEISQLVGAGRVTVIVTDMFGALLHEHLVTAKGNVMYQRRADILLAARTPVGKILELYNILAAIQPTRIFLLANHMDIIAHAALWPFRGVTDFLHHADHQPALGATLGYSAHIDLNFTCHKTCRRAGLPAAYSGMTASLLPRQLATDRARGPRRIGTSGAAVKFRGPSTHAWSDYVRAALALPGAEVVHFGDTDAEFRDSLAGALRGAGLDSGRYVYAGVVADFPAELRARKIDTYLSSYPVTGGKANLEAMAAGLPPIVPIDPDFPDQMRFDFPLESWIEIGCPQELAGALDRARALRNVMSRASSRSEMQRQLDGFRAYVVDAQVSTPSLDKAGTA